MTEIAVDGEDWWLDGTVTYPGRRFEGRRVEGLLLNSRMANGVFDDLNPLTRALWAYPDTARWDADRNVAELAAALPAYRARGLLAVSVNLQGGSPLGYYRAHAADEIVARVRRAHPDAGPAAIWAALPGLDSQPWDSGAFEPGGRLRAPHAARAGRLIEAADRLGMAVILGLFYFGQDERLAGEAAVRRAVDEACGWVLDRGYRNVLIEIDNECDIPRYEHEILTPVRVHELIGQARGMTRGGRRLLAGTSFTRRLLPPDAVCAASDFILLHGNGVDEPGGLARMVAGVRALPAYRAMPIVFNEDDHFGFAGAESHALAAIGAHASWGYFDPGPGAGGGCAWGDYVEGYQIPPVNWGASTARKRAFLDFVAEVTGAPP